MARGCGFFAVREEVLGESIATFNLSLTLKMEAICASET
jgi:hypothetical protein